MRVRIGVRQAKELDLDVEDSQAVVASYDKAVADGERMLWITEVDGRRYGVLTELVAYIELETEASKRVGFTPE